VVAVAVVILLLDFIQLQITSNGNKTTNIHLYGSLALFFPDVYHFLVYFAAFSVSRCSTS